MVDEPTVVEDRPPWGVVVRRHRAARLWDLVAGQRGAVADHVLELAPHEWDETSRCPGWRVRDVLGHLVHMAESTRRSMAKDLRTSGRKDRDEAFAECARRIGAEPVPDLARRLRRAARSTYSGLPTVALSELVVHGDDMFQPLDRRMTIDPETAWATLGRMRMVDRLVPGFAFHGRSHRGVRLVATDVAWSSGAGPR